MTDKASPDEPNGGTAGGQFLRDWTALWREELRAQANDPDAMAPLAMLARMANGGMSTDVAAATELWRAAVIAWADLAAANGTRPDKTRPNKTRSIETGAGASESPPGVPPSRAAHAHDATTTPGAQAAAAAFNARDAEIERLARRVDELEARLAKLATPRRRRG